MNLVVGSLSGDTGLGAYERVEPLLDTMPREVVRAVLKSRLGTVSDPGQLAWVTAFAGPVADESMTPTFANLLEHESEDIRYLAAQGLGFIGTEASRSILRDRLPKETEEFVRKAILEEF